MSDRVGFGEALRETNSAHLVSLSSNSIEEGLMKMLDDPEYCKELVANAQNLVRSRYDIEIVAKNLLEEFRKIVR
ncbi:glycosyltransferase [Pseudarcicella hirudinis]